MNVFAFTRKYFQKINNVDRRDNVPLTLLLTKEEVTLPDQHKRDKEEQIPGRDINKAILVSSLLPSNKT